MNIIYRSFVYDFLYLLAGTAIKRINPCKIHAADTGQIICVNSHPCCSGCQYISDTGCTVKCLGCKLGLCSTAGNEHANLQKRLCRMKYVATCYHLRRIRTAKVYVMDDLKREQGVKIGGYSNYRIGIILYPELLLQTIE